MGNSDSEPDPAIQARVAEIMAEIAAGLRWQSPKPGDPPRASEDDPEAHVVAALTADERQLWHRLQPADRVKLTREFRGGITPNGRSYLAKVIVLLAPPAPDDQAEAPQPSAVSSSPRPENRT
jgi:hypothetical protein